MKLSVGTRLCSVVCDTEVIVVRAGSSDDDLCCGGRPMVPKEQASSASKGAPSPDLAGGTVLGKRYVDEDAGLEVLVTKAGAGTLSLGTEPLAVKEAKRLPTSD